MPPRRTLDAFLNQGEQRGGQDEQGIINDDEVRKALQPGTERNYDRSVALWDTYARRMPGANLDNFETPKDFMRKIAHAIDGRYGDPKACLTTVVQYWKNLTAGWRQTGRPKIRDDVVLSTSNFIKGPLQNEMKLARQKRARRFGTMLHFVYLGTQLWKYDWHLYDSPRDRLDLWDGIMLNVFTSARVGEYIESTAREGSGRGLHYKDVEFVVFRNEHGNPEFAMEVKKDGKGMRATPWRNPEHALHEGSGLHPLLCNPMLTRVAILLAKGAFRDFKTVDELLKVEPPKEGIVRIEWHPDFRNQPVYERDNGHIWVARTYCSHLSAAGIRAGFPSLQNHDFRAEGLRAINESYSSSQRRRHAGHGSDDVYDKYYAPTNPGTDGQGAYAGDPLRTLLPKLLRILKMNHNPALAQTLPARELHELITSDEYSAIANELEGLADCDCDDESSKKRRADLLASLRKLKLSALQRYRDQQASNPFRTTNTDDVRHYRTPFSRIRHLMPIRDRLAESMFTVAPIHSEAGRAVLEDLIALYQSKVEVQHRPGLEPEQCHCPTHPDQNKRFADLCEKMGVEIQPTYAGGTSTAVTSDTSLPFAEFCFLCTDGKWFTSQASWASHCESHLTSLDALPFQCNPLIYAKTLAAPGLCFWCLGDTSLAPASRLQQFLTRAQWQTHVEKHAITELSNGGKMPACPHPRCTDTFESLGELNFHLQDIHCWIPRDPTKPGRTAVKRSCSEEDEDMPRKRTKRDGGRRRRRRRRGKVVPGSFVFVNQTVNFGESDFWFQLLLRLLTSNSSLAVSQSVCVLDNCDMANG